MSIRLSEVLGSTDLHAEMRHFLTSTEYPILALVHLLEMASRNDKARELTGLVLWPVQTHCVAELKRRLVTPARAADDWSITPPKQCSCPLCVELSQFLIARSRITFEWPLATDKRSRSSRIS